MHYLKRFLDFYINSSCHVALAVCSLVMITYSVFDVSVNNNLLFFVFFATVSGYNFVKYYGLARFHHRSLAVWLKYIQVFSFLSFFAMLYFLIKLELKTIYLLGIMALITFLYAVPFIPNKLLLDERKNLRAISGIKIFVIALIWAFVTVVIPLVNSGYTLDFDVWVTTIQRFLFVLVLILPFEIRDLTYDSLRLSTIPQKIGVNGTKVLGGLLIVVLLLLEFLKDIFITKYTIELVVIGSITMIFLLASKERQRAYFSSFWVEAIPILWLVISYSTS